MKASTPDAKYWALLAMLVLLYSVSVFDRVIISMVVDPIRTTLHIDDVQMGFLLGLGFVVSYASCGIPMGWLADRFPRRLIIFIGVMIWGLATAACGMAGSYAQFFAARLMVGAGEAALTPSAHSMISDAFPRKKLALAISIYSLGGVIGPGLSFVLGGMLVSHVESLPSTQIAGWAFEPWQLVFLVASLPALLLAICIFLVPEPPRGERFRQERSASLLSFLRLRWRLWLSFTMIFGAMSVVMGAMMFWQPTYLSRYFHWPASQIGLALGVVSTSGGVVGLLFSGWLVDRLYQRGVKDAALRYYFWALLLSAPLVLIALTSHNVWVYLGLIWFAYSMLINKLGFGSAAVQMTTPPALRGQASALFTAVLISLFGAGLGPVVPALILKHVIGQETQVGQALAVTVAVCVVIALIGCALGMKPLREAVEELEPTPAPFPGGALAPA